MKLAEVYRTYESSEAFVLAMDVELRRIMEANPDFVYQPDPDTGARCSYRRGPSNDPDRCCGCVFGQAFRAIGASDLLGLDTCGSANISGVIRHFCDFECPKYWTRIQDKQDAGSKWDECLKHLPEVPE